MFDLILVADWSSAAAPSPARPSEDAIWVCADLRGAQEVAYFRTRAAALAWIEDWLGRGHRTLLGFDFAFGYPEGFAARLTGEDRALAVWDWLAARVTDGPDNANDRFEVAAEVNRAFPGTGPLWGRPAGRDLPDLPSHGTARAGHGLASDRRRVDALARGAQPVVKLAGAGSVGGQSLVGLAALAGLRRRHGLRVWPQETGFVLPEGGDLLVEVFPSLFWTRPPKPARPEGMIADREQVVATARALRAAPADWYAAPAVLPDAARIAREEGWILGMGPEGPLAVPQAAAGEGSIPGVGTDRAAAAGDCFALPPGVAWTPVDVALATLRAACPVAVGVETVPVGAARGRVLAADLAALRANPLEANAAVDGWGFAHGTVGDGPVRIAAGRAAAGRPFGAAVPPGHALRILTGAALPAGIDTVALQEDAEVADDALTLRAVPRRGANTRAAGEDVGVGAPVLAAGAVLRPTDLAFAVAAGHGALPVRARLRVGVLSTGDEIVGPGEAGGIPDANRPMLLAMLGGWGLAAVDLGHAPDDAGRLTAVLDGAAVDAVLTSGGASAGDEDHLSRLMRERGSVHHWRIAIKPGRPLMLGTWGGVPLFGLPGNPVAAFTCAALFARPALLQMAGAGWREPAWREVPAGFAKRKRAGRREVLRARLRDGRAEAFRSEGSGLVSGLAWAEGFVELPDAAVAVEPGDPVRYVSFAELGVG